jgi:large subunit ribosomal protein L17
MRHQLKGRKLNRTKGHRKALFANMATSLFQFEKIKTTLPKAKELRSVAEKLITVGKKGSLHAHRQLVSSLKSGDVAKKVLTELSKRYATRAGGYTRIIKAGFRYGDAAPMAIIELVDRPLDVASVDLPDTEKAESAKGEKAVKETKAKPAKKKEAAA